MAVGNASNPLIPATTDGLEVNKRGNIVVNPETNATSIPGVYAAGDARTKPMRQIVTAVADGAVAVHMAEKFLSDREG